MLKYSISAICAAILFVSCHQDTPENAAFKLLKKDKTGLDFQNTLKPTLAFNALNYMYYFNGGGVAAGDFNNDGKVDLYFTSNMGENKLYLNEGNMHFRDVTDQAGVACVSRPLEGGDVAPKWSTGASVIDINNDGLLDIYVSQVGKYLVLNDHNHLFVCKGIQNGVPVYEDQAIQYGLDLVGFGTQAAFLDYDGDGDLDMFQLNHSVHANGTFGQKKSFEGTQHPLSGDKLMRNDGGKFTEVTMQAGIKSTVIGYGLGIVTGDVNNDGWPDIYIGNDFHEDDYLYINQGDGTFKESLRSGIQHTSQFSMGVDIGDLDNDGWSEIISLDMLPEDPEILKKSLGEDEFGLYRFKLEYGYGHQYARNTLQKNNGDAQAPFSCPTFSEVGMFSGVYATDWSWAALFTDFDNDGYKDLFISNGIERRMNDIDYANFRLSDDVHFRQGANDLEERDLKVIDLMPQIKLPNKFFHNGGSLHYQDMEKQILGAVPSYSNGAVYADLDNDGDLDMVVNNLADEPFVYENLDNHAPESAHHYIDLKLSGSPQNRSAIGARAIVYKAGTLQTYENFPVRGYQSSALIPMHLGLGDPKNVDSILLVWPDQSYQQVPVNQTNTTISLEWKSGLPRFDFRQLRRPPVEPYQFEDVTENSGLNFTHVENAFVEFDRENLIPHMVSTEGPALAVGDINGDGLEDVFLGSSKRKKCALFIQQSDGRFAERTPAAMQADSVFEEVDAVFADLDNDGDLDLAVASGGNEYRDQNEPMHQHIYLNDGHGNMTRKDLDGIFMTASCVLAADFNHDGLIDLFYGARAVPWNYGVTPRSALLLNRGNGNFEDVAEKIGGGLAEAGLIKSGTWCDIDQDGDPDLLLAIEWEPPTLFVNNNGTFQKKVLNNMTGWWNFLLPYDFDGDGDIDILAGNLGENNKFHPTPDQPVRMYVNDFDDNQQIEQILTYYVKGKEIPFANYAEITKQLPIIKKKYLLAKNFSKASLQDLFGKEKLEKAIHREANTFESMYFENTGNLSFKAHQLPDVLQYSPIKAASIADLDGDGQPEILLGGNFYESNIEMGRYDANYGNVLKIGKDGKMDVFPLGDLRLRGQVRRIAQVKRQGKTAFIFARNDDKALVIKPK